MLSNALSMSNWLNKTHVGDCRILLRQMAADGVQVQTCITSPPYFRLRDYGVAGQIGLEATPGEYISELVQVFRLVRELLSPDGTLWLVLGDSYAGNGMPGQQNIAQLGQRYAGGGHKQDTVQKPPRALADGLKAKDLVGMPWRVALALQSDGWYLRSDIIEEVELYCPCGCGFVLEERLWRWTTDRDLIWCKPNALPESVRDRPTRCHEYIFLLSKSERYYCDAATIRERATSGPSDVRKMVEGLPRIGGKHKDLVDGHASASSDTNIGQKRSVGNGYWRPGVLFGGSRQRPSAAHTSQHFPALLSSCAFWRVPDQAIQSSSHSWEAARRDRLPVTWVGIASDVRSILPISAWRR
jgi:DNA methylase